MHGAAHAGTRHGHTNHTRTDARGSQRRAPPVGLRRVVLAMASLAGTGHAERHVSAPTRIAGWTCRSGTCSGRSHRPLLRCVHAHDWCGVPSVALPTVPACWAWGRVWCHGLRPATLTAQQPRLPHETTRAPTAWLRGTRASALPVCFTCCGTKEGLWWGRSGCGLHNLSAWGCALDHQKRWRCRSESMTPLDKPARLTTHRPLYLSMKE